MSPREHARRIVEELEVIAIQLGATVPERVAVEDVHAISRRRSHPRFAALHAYCEAHKLLRMLEEMREEQAEMDAAATVDIP